MRCPGTEACVKETGRGRGRGIRGGWLCGGGGRGAEPEVAGAHREEDEDARFLYGGGAVDDVVDVGR